MSNSAETTTGIAPEYDYSNFPVRDYDYQPPSDAGHEFPRPSRALLADGGAVPVRQVVDYAEYSGRNL